MRQPLEMPGRYCFHSTRPALLAVSAALNVDRQKSGVNFNRTRQLLQCLAVEVRKALEDRPDRATRHPLHSLAPYTGSRRSPCVMPGDSFRPLVSQLWPRARSRACEPAAGRRSSRSRRGATA
jgi:hypothetical protein